MLSHICCHAYPFDGVFPGHTFGGWPISFTHTLSSTILVPYCQGLILLVLPVCSLGPVAMRITSLCSAVWYYAREDPVLALCCHVRIILAQNQISMRDLPRRTVGYNLVSAVGERFKVSTLKAPRALKRCGIRVPPPSFTTGIVRVYSSCLNSIYLPSFPLLFSLSPLLLLSSSSSTFQTSPPAHYCTLRHSIAFPVLAIVYLALLFPSLR
ncbi:hypothetical protein B9Z19DRAFT_530306 [Tuber borchii]|uniref:Uncharacterized protein n=1 Tax=Tuber borchii TaxID=42251 RepID=A0A2T6ZDK3_TUBBO|nr:hypothetical protein B9Z19DRAFT_530306 [Tuber borchii]